jgi:mono/diheme cytochrome c family protein
MLNRFPKLERAVWFGLAFVTTACGSSLANDVFANDVASALTKPSADPHIAFRGHTSAFLKKYCVSCHGVDAQEADLRFDDIPPDMQNADTSDVWRRILEQVLFSEMPPPESDELPGTAERKQFVEYVEAELTRFGRGLSLDDKLLLPEYGNFVDHEQLFDGSIQEKAYTPARLWRQRPDIYRRIWGRHYGRKHWYSVKIGGTERKGDLYTVRRGPQKGKTISGRYFADERFANPFYEYVHHAAGFTDYATIVADQASLESLLINAEAMSEILTLGTKVTIVTEVKSKDSRHGNNHGGFVGGVETISHEQRGRIPVAFKRVMESSVSVSKEDFHAALRIAFDLFLRREPTEEDVEHYWQDVFLKNAELGNTTALQAVLIFVTISPEFVYRMEMGLGDADEHGRRMLSPHELVYAIQYAFQNTPAFGVDEFETEDAYQKISEPLITKAMTEQNGSSYARNGWLAEQMKAGGLKTREDVEKAVRQFLGGRSGNLNPNHNSPISSTKNPRILQFFREFFGYHKAPTVFKDVDKFVKEKEFAQFHSHSAIRMMYDTDSLILHILEEDRNVLRELLTTNKVFVSYWDGSNKEDQIKRKRNRANYAATHDSQNYNLDPFENEHPRNTPLEVLPEQRCGILTQPSWLVAHSGNFDNDPVRRGKWIRENLLADYIMDVPITVDAQIPDDETKTLRERFSVVHEESCWRCHKKMNPLGMPFEAFNHVGRFRTMEKDKPVDTSGAISHSGIERLDGEVENVREMMERLADSPRVRQSFIRHVFRYWMGRNELLSDSQTLIAMDRAYVENEGSFKETLVALLASDSFLFRK